MNILAIDTSNQALGVALMKDNVLAADYQLNIKRNHSVQLMPAIHRLMEEAEMKPKELDCIAVAHGPGSFTGVRIGLTTAKTLAWTLSIPIVPVSSLEVAAYNAVAHTGYVCPFFDARRGLVYTGLYKANGAELTPVGEEINTKMTDWLGHLQSLQQPVLFISSDMALHEENITEVLGDNAIIPDAPVHLPKAGMLAHIAKRKQAVSVHEITPNYLRLAEAESKWLEKQQENMEL
ncbi:tRNA (adenosine(37)-N6)-threonylcarbamoyltransferase complex dimerization subunit type 1 TsaB [Pontibacillus salicampi]|uniref:tRNA (Adenosine(37)-N6)-threonylcarbamoyltransferase complex dimerization subunit type 1 TsaB n=1 Tax=Pontibacillus salicampi TaxID=1449801 RepID=A0ABV6LTV7_9BACI